MAIGQSNAGPDTSRSEEHTSELQSRSDLVCRLLLEKKKKTNPKIMVQSTSSHPPCITTSSVPTDSYASTARRLNGCARAFLTKCVVRSKQPLTAES